MIEILEEFKKIWEIDRDADDCVEDGDWISNYKYEYKTDVFKYKDVYIEVNQSRQGSYHTDYYYLDPDFSIVVPRKVIKEFTVYDRVK